MPDALEFLVLLLASYRVTRLLGQDDLPPLVRLRERLTRPYMGQDGWEFGRPTLAYFLSCPFCLGWWVSLAVYGAWLSAPRPTLYAMTPFAISGAVGLIAKNLDD